MFSFKLLFMIRLLNLLFAILCVIAFSCKPDILETNLGSLDISDGFALVIPDTSNTYNPKLVIETNKSGLYKITGSSSLQNVSFISTDGRTMDDKYNAEAMYDLNAAYLFIVLSKINTTPKLFESYVVNKYTGDVKATDYVFYPQTIDNGILVIDYRSKAFKMGKENEFYCFFDQSIEKISISKSNEVSFNKVTIPSTTNSSFKVDNEGNIFTDGKIVTSSATVDVEWYVSGKSIISKGFSKGFFMTTAKDTSIEISKLTIENDVVKSEILNDIGKGSDPWLFRGSAAFTNLNCTFFMFNKGIISINNLETKMLPLSIYQLSSIDLFDYSKKKLYFTGSSYNDENKKMFVELNPEKTSEYSSTPSTTSYVSKINVTLNNIVTYISTHFTNNTETFYVIPETENVKEVVNKQKLTVKQIMGYR